MGILLDRVCFQALDNADLARRLFKQNVGRVEVETHSYCNRRCSYCPNVVGDRLGPNERMAPELYDMITRDLGTIDYSGRFVMQGYNEPLYDRAILERIAEARQRVPKAEIIIYTNGDYLDAAYLDELADAGLDVLHISIHLKMGDAYSDRYVLGRINEIARRVESTAVVKTRVPNRTIQGIVRHEKLKIIFRAENFWHDGNTRGNLIEGIETAQAVRTSPCLVPFGNFYVGYSGNIVPCCHIRSDREEHADYLIGNLGDFTSIFQAYASDGAASWRRSLIGEGPKEAPCDRCTADIVTGKNLENCRTAYSRHVAPYEVPETA